MRKHVFSLTLAAVTTVASLAQAAPIVFDFVDSTVTNTATKTSAFDGGVSGNGGVGANFTGTDGITPVKLTTADIQAPEYSGTTLTGNQTSAAGRSGFVSALNVTNLTSSVSNEQMGVNNITVSDADGVTAGLGSAEAGNFNVNEAWVFSFDTVVTFDIMNLASVDSVDTITVTVGATSFTLIDGATNDDYTDPFSGLQIPANTEISFKNTSSTANSIVRIDSFTVSPVPEPAGLALAGIALLGIARRRRA